MLLLLLFVNIPEGRDSFAKLPTGNEMIIKHKAINYWKCGLDLSG